MQSRGPGNTHREVAYLSWAAPPYAYACGCVLTYVDKRLTMFNTYTHPTDQPIAHLRGQHPMTACEPPMNLNLNLNLFIAFVFFFMTHRGTAAGTAASLLHQKRFGSG